MVTFPKPKSNYHAQISTQEEDNLSFFFFQDFHLKSRNLTSWGQSRLFRDAGNPIKKYREI